MSEMRQKSGNILLKIKGNETINFEWFPAVQWKYLFKGSSRRFYPRPERNNDKWWNDKWRLKVNGIWLRTMETKYSFLTKDQMMKIISDRMKI